MAKIANVVYLDITSWTGISIGAEHYYGKLKFYDFDDDSQQESVELKKVLTKAEAIKLSKKDVYPNVGLSAYKAGHATGRFDTPNEVYLAAIKYLKDKNLLSRCDFILEGRYSYPAKVLWARNEKVKKTLNDLYELWHAATPAKQDRAIDAWCKVAKRCRIL